MGGFRPGSGESVRKCENPYRVDLWTDGGPDMRLGPFEFKPSPGNLFAGFVALLTLAVLIYLPIGSIRMWHAFQNRRHAAHDAALPHAGQPVRDGVMAF